MFTQTGSRIDHRMRAARRRLATQEAPILLAIGVLLGSWLLLTLAG